MKELIEFLSEQNGLVNLPLIILGVVLLFMVFTLFNKEAKKNGKNYVNKKINVNSEFDLLQHDLFIREDKYHRIASGSNFGDTINNEIFKIILKNKIKSTVRLTKDVIINTDVKSISVKQLEAKLYENNRNIADNYNFNIRNDLIETYGPAVGNNIYEHVMNTYPTGFNPTHTQEMDYLDSMIADVICKEKTSILNCNLNRFELYLYFLNSMLYVSMIEAENMFYNFNGELQKIKDAIQK